MNNPTRPRAFKHHYDDHGRRTKPAEQVWMRLCTGAEPQVFTIELRDKRSTKFTCLQISRAEIERVLKANPLKRKRSLTSQQRE